MPYEASEKMQKYASDLRSRMVQFIEDNIAWAQAKKDGTLDDGFVHRKDPSSGRAYRWYPPTKRDVELSDQLIENERMLSMMKSWIGEIMDADLTDYYVSKNIIRSIKMFPADMEGYIRAIRHYREE